MNKPLIALTRLLNSLESLRIARRLQRLDARVDHYWLEDDGTTIRHELVEYAPTDTELAEAETLSGADTYAKEIRGIARLVWRGEQIDAFGIMWELVGSGIIDAWNAGAATCGIAAGELTADERLRRDSLVVEQRNRVFGFLDWVHVHRRDGEMPFPWATIQSRAATWGNAANRAYNEGQARACADQKLKWVLNLRRVTKETCADCDKLNGRIYRASTWAKWSIYPQSSQLACKGFNCGCGWMAAGPDERVTPGRPPRLKFQ